MWHVVVLLMKGTNEALDEGQISRAAIDVFEHEPATDSPLVAHDKIIDTSFKILQQSKLKEKWQFLFQMKSSKF